MSYLFSKFKQCCQKLVAVQAKRKARKEGLNFLPSALEIEKRPPHPMTRIVLLVLVSLIVISLLWACIGRMDVLVTGQGKVAPHTQVKSIQPLDKGVITSILVSDGQLVKKSNFN